MFKALSRIALLASCLASAAAWAEAPVLSNGHLSLEATRQVIAAAEMTAKRYGSGGAIAVVDEGGHLISLARLDNTFPAAATVSIGKARTAALFRKPTGDFERIINEGRYTMTALPDFTPLQGGVPILHEGRVVGAIGVSGAASAQQDEQIAMAGAAAVSGMPRAEAEPAPSDPGRSRPKAVPGGEGLKEPEPKNGKVLVNVDRRGVALQGYDPVAFFSQKKPVKGNPKISAEHRGAAYHFASEADRQTFIKDPTRYEPQYGGYCGYAVSINRIAPIDVDFFQVIEGRLILQHNKRAWDLWGKDLPGNIRKADENWPGLVERNGQAPNRLINVDKHGLALQGFDPVAYFTHGEPVKGTPAQQSTYAGAIYHFASEANRAIFEKEPAKYEPAFGGYCAYAASINKISPINPKYWQVEDGRLLLQHTQKAYDLFNEDTEGNLRKADRNWPGLTAKNARKRGGWGLW